MSNTEAMASVARCTAEGLKIRATAGEPDEIAATLEALDKYLGAFAQPTEDMKCLKCGTVQTGFAAQMLGSGFQWGLRNGEGACATCGWPARGFHNIPDVGTLNMVLQYHPDFVPEDQDE